MNNDIRVFNGKEVFTNITQLNFGNSKNSKEFVGINSKGETCVDDYVSIDYPVRMNDINKQPIYENDIVKYRNEIFKVVFNGRGVIGLNRDKNKKKRKLFLGPGCEIIGNVYQKEFFSYMDL